MPTGTPPNLCTMDSPDTPLEVESRFIAAFTHSPLWLCRISWKDLAGRFSAYPTLSNVKNCGTKEGFMELLGKFKPSYSCCVNMD